MSLSPEQWNEMVAAVDTATVPADACETVATVNVAMFDATGVESDGGVRILGGCALS